MRLLAISDIHNNVSCVRKLRAQELNNFDVLVIAGDIGSYRADEVFKVLKSFKCPIIYVFGNWDPRLPRSLSFGKRCHLLHLNIVQVGPLTFTGFSFPISLSKLSYAQYSARCQRIISKALARERIDPSRTVLVAHERASHLARTFPNLLLHLYGHIHTFDVFQRGATTYVNPSALDRICAVLPPSSSSASPRWPNVRHANVGNYAVIDIGRGGEISVDCRILRRSHENWITIDSEWKNGVFGGALIPEDAVFGDNVRFLASVQHERPEV